MNEQNRLIPAKRQDLGFDSGVPYPIAQIRAAPAVPELAAAGQRLRTDQIGPGVGIQTQAG